MEFTQYDLDTINLLVVSYFKNGEAKTPDDVSRVLALVMKSRSQGTTAAPLTPLGETIKRLKDEAEKQKKFEPKVPWPEPPQRSWRNEEIGLGAAPMVYCGDPITGSLDRDFPRTA